MKSKFEASGNLPKNKAGGFSPREIRLSVPTSGLKTKLVAGGVLPNKKNKAKTPPYRGWLRGGQVITPTSLLETIFNFLLAILFLPFTLLFIGIMYLVYFLFPTQGQRW